MSWRYQHKSRGFSRGGGNKSGLFNRLSALLTFRQSASKTLQTDNLRIRFLSAIFLIVGLLLIGRLFDLQVLQGSAYAALAADQHELYQKLFPIRGSIYVTEEGIDNKQILYPLVANKTMYVVYAVPKEIIEATSTAERVLDVLGLPDNNDDLSFAQTASSSLLLASGTPISAQDFKKVSLINQWVGIFAPKEKVYYPLRDRVEADQVDKLKALNLPGIGWSKKSYRYYTEKGIGGQLFGFWGYDGDERKGKYGLEGYFDDVLAGQMGAIKSERDAKGNTIALGDSELTEKVDGADLILTINRALQFNACEALKKSVTDHGAKSGSIIVMDPSTGAILAMCSVPDYDPDKYYEVKDANVFNNRAIFDSYEPGSVFKVITMAGAIDAGKVTPDTNYTDTGFVDYGDYKIRNYEDKTYGFSSMTKVLEYSINTGVIFAMRQMGVPAFVDYVKRFGFGQDTGLELQKEATGNIANLDRKGEINKATATFGQGITVTPIQLITAFCAVINGGKLMKPYIVAQEIRNNEVIKTTEPQLVKQVISARTSLTMKAMMVSVVDNHVKSAVIPGYRVGGKTGTAQIPNKAGGYYPDDVVIGSFAGFVPYSNPKIAILVRIDEPISNRTGEGVAVPVFNEVAKFAAQYYNLPKDK